MTSLLNQILPNPPQNISEPSNFCVLTSTNDTASEFTRASLLTSCCFERFNKVLILTKKRWQTCPRPHGEFRVESVIECLTANKQVDFVYPESSQQLSKYLAAFEGHHLIQKAVPSPDLIIIDNIQDFIYESDSRLENDRRMSKLLNQLANTSLGLERHRGPLFGLDDGLITSKERTVKILATFIPMVGDQDIVKRFGLFVDEIWSVAKMKNGHTFSCALGPCEGNCITV